MSGFGLGGFGLGPYGAPTPPIAVEPTTTAISCRRIDPVARDYVSDAGGNPLPEDGTASRVYLLASYADAGAPDVITPQALQDRAAKVRTALQPLTTGPSPAIAKLQVEITDQGGSHVFGMVTYLNLATQQIESVQLR